MGEASSAHHAWVVGSFNSAYSAVAKFLKRFELEDAYKRLKKEWGTVDEVEDGVRGTLHLQVALGKLKKGEYVSG